MGIYELLFMDEAIRPLIMGRAVSSTIAQMAMSRGMRTLRNDGWKKVRGGPDHHRGGAARHPNRGASHGAVGRRENSPPQEGPLMSRWYSANVLQALPQGGPPPLALFRQGRPLCF